MRIRKGIFFTIFFSFISLAHSQIKQIELGTGITYFLGDVTGKISPALKFNYLYRNNRIGFKTCLTSGVLSGNDNISNDIHKKNRNINFVSRIFEISERVQYNLYPNKTSGFNCLPYLGIGLMYFNPKALYNGVSYSLRDLSTEGQGLPNGPKPYNIYTTIFPMGLEVSYTVRRFALSLDYNYIYSISDYIDDTSTIYYDNNDIRLLKGDVAAELADPSLGIAQKKPIASGQPRGNSDTKDGFVILSLLLQYKM